MKIVSTGTRVEAPHALARALAAVPASERGRGVPIFEGQTNAKTGLMGDANETDGGGRDQQREQGGRKDRKDRRPDEHRSPDKTLQVVRLRAAQTRGAWGGSVHMCSQQCSLVANGKTKLICASTAGAIGRPSGAIYPYPYRQLRVRISRKTFNLDTLSSLCSLTLFVCAPARTRTSKRRAASSDQPRRGVGHSTPTGPRSRSDGRKGRASAAAAVPHAPRTGAVAIHMDE